MAALEVASLFGTLDLRDNTAGALRNFSRGFDSLEDRVGRFGRQIQGLGGMLTGITAPFVAFGVRGIKVASDFENVLSEIGSRAGLTASELAQVSDFALQMGADTAFSAQEAADAFLQLLTSGQDVTQAFKTLPAVLTAAAASGEDLGMTADMVTDILAAFGLGVGDAESVVNDLARAAGASSATMSSLGQGIGNVGPIARQFGLSFKETSAILSVFEENGIKGAEAGTQLRSMLTGMTRGTEESVAAWERLGTSMYDATGKVRPIGEILQDIRRGLAGMTEEQQITTLQDLAGAYGQVGLAVLTAGDPLRDMLDLMDGAASAAEVAAERMNTFDGRVEALRGSFETLQTRAFTPFNESLIPTIERVTAFVNRLSEWAEANPQVTTTIIRVVGAVAGLGAGLLAIGTAITFAAPAIGLLGGLLTLVTGPVGLLVGGGLLLAHVLGVDLVDAFQDLRTHSREAFDTIRLGAQMLSSGFKLQEVGRFASALIGLGIPAEFVTGAIFKMLVRLKNLREVFSDFKYLTLPEIRGTLETPDFSGIATSIRAGFYDMDFGDVQSIFERHFGDILKLVGTAASIIFGGPVGWVIGIGSLIASAIENDFLGIGAFLKESGISGFVETAFNDVRTEIERVWGEVLSFLNLGGSGGTNPLQPVIDWFTGTGANTVRGAIEWLDMHVMPIVDDFIALLGGIWAEVEPALGPLGRWFTDDVLPLMQNTLENIFLPALSLVIEVLKGIWAVVGPPLGDLLEWFTKEGLPAATDFLNDTVVPAIGDFIDLLSGIWQAVEPHLIAFRDGVGAIFGWIKTNVLDPITDAIEAVQRALNGLTAPPTGGGGPPAYGPPGGTPWIPGMVGIGYGRNAAVQPYLISGGAQPQPQAVADYAGEKTTQARGLTVIQHIMMPERALLSPDEARERGREFGQAAGEELRKIGGLA